MRYANFCLIASALLSNGCSVLIARSGVDLHTLTTREKVHEKFGKPSASGTAEGKPFEEFRTRRKIAEPFRGDLLGMSFAWTWGLAEVITFPYELYLLGNRSLLGQDIRFTYDSSGIVRHIHRQVDCEWIPEMIPWPPSLMSSGPQPRDQN